MESLRYSGWLFYIQDWELTHIFFKKNKTIRLAFTSLKYSFPHFYRILLFNTTALILDPQRKRDLLWIQP